MQVAISLTGRSIAVLLAQTIRVYQLDLETGLSHSPRFSKAIRLLEDQYGQGVAFAGDDNLFVATRNERGAIICRTNLLNTEPEFTKIHESNDPLLLYSTSDFRGTGWMTITKTPTVTIFCPRPSELIPRSLENGDHERIPEVPTAHFAVMSTEDVVDCQSGLSQGVAYTFCLLDSGALIFHTSEGSKRLVNNCTSFLVNASHLVFTTTSHVLKFVHLPNIQKLEIPEDDPDKDERVRSVERGALLVTMMPSSSSVVLQMPRGNLETVYPRLLVLSRIRRLLREKVYDGAFRVCRRHRVDLNILFDLDPQEFLRNVEVFIKQLHKAELIDIFLAELRDEDVTQTLYRETLPISAPAEDLPIPLEETNITPSEKADLNHTPALEAPNPSSKVNRICDAFIELLPTVSPSNARSLITAYVCKKPPEIDIALQRIAQIGEHGSDRRRLILEHLCFLVDVNLVYDHALGLYDLQLAVQIARQSQKDPREYLPFLQNLQEMPEHQKCFNIDDTLKRRDRALGHLKAGGDFEVLLRYVSLYGLHEEALALYRDEVKASAALTELYAAELHRQSRFREAGTAYQSLAKYELAKDSYLAASECWREALNCAELASTPAEQLSGLARRFLDSSVEADHHADAAVICANYLSDWDGAVRYLVKAAQFSDAMRMLVRHSEPSTYVAKFEGVYDKALTEVLATDIGLLANMTSQLQAQVPRIMELRGRRATDPLAFYGGHGRGDRDADDNIPDDVSLAASTVNSHLSTSASLFTRYTSSSATGSALTGKTTRRSKRREDRKRAQGKRGTVYEEEYLLSSVCRLIKRAAEARQDVDALLEALIRRGMIVQAQSVKNNWDKLQQAIDMSRALICGSGESKPTTDQSSALTPEVEMIEQVRAAPEIKALSNVTMLGR